MNKKLLYAFVAGSLLSLSSCNDFLDVTPASGFTPDYVFSSETEMKSLMTRIYSSMTEDGLYGSIWPADLIRIPMWKCLPSRTVRSIPQGRI